MNDSLKIPKIFFYSSLISLLYFWEIVYWSYYPPASTAVIRFFGELLTIPMFILVLLNFFYSTIRMVKKRHLKINIATFIFSLFSILFLIIVTINQMN